MTEKNSFDFDKYKEHTLTRPRDEAWSNWHSWKDAEIGAKVQGYVADAFFRPEEKDDKGVVAFRSQRGITLKQLDGSLVNVGIKDLPFVLAATDGLHVGDPLTIELTKLGEKQKGKAQAKIFSYYGTNLPQNESKPTVKALTDADRVTGGTKEPVAKPGEAPSDEEDIDDVAEELNAEGNK